MQLCKGKSSNNKKRYILNNLIISSFTGETKHKVPAGVEEEHRKNGAVLHLYHYTSYKV